MSITTGATYIKHNLDGLDKEIKGRIARLIRETTEEIAQEYKDAVSSGSRSGRHSKEHTASAPGEAPADLTHELVNSVVTEYPSEYQGVMRVNALHAGVLEYGTLRIAARPALIPIMERKGPEYRRRAAEVIDGAVHASEVR